MISQELSFVTLVLVIITNVFANEDAFCVTPNGEKGICVLITDCPIINKPYLTGDNRAKAFVQQSLCGFEEDTPLVCCGSKSSFINDSDVRSDEHLRKQKMEESIENNFLSKHLPDRSICGLERTILDRIYFGEETRLDEFPWMAALEYRNRRTQKIEGVKCGGTIINNRYVLTAAHCLTNAALEVFQVRLGEWNITDDPDCEDLLKQNCADPVQIISIEKIIAHPYYHGRTKNNDIGLLRLSSNITYSNYIRPICLASLNSPALASGLKLIISGWGATENGSSSEVKLKTGIPLLNNKQCKNSIQRNLLNDVHIGLSQICAGGEEGKDACQGDSGGPLMRAYEDQINGQVQWYQEGIVSWGILCGTPNPAVYTNVRKYRNWIHNQLE